jgi:dTDP-4-amino-4,6-dideoxygalactose transaminase
MTNMIVPYTALAEEYKINREEYISAFDKTLLSGRYILGPELENLETEFSQFCQTKYGVGVATGTDALYLTLRCLDLKSTDEVITAPNSYIASASAIAIAGAQPRFADICHCGNISPEAFEAAITPNTKAVIPVHLTGRPAEMKKILEIAKKNNIFVIEDAAQAVGATLDGQKVGSWGDAACFSFHPLKNLRAFGDGGMVVTRHKWLYEKLRKQRNQGLENRDQCDYWGFNSRLDELQAALIRIQLRNLDDQTEKRRKAAHRYNKLLRPFVEVPLENAGEFCVYQTYVIKTPLRDALKTYLNNMGIEALVHYARPIHMQPAANYLGYQIYDFPRTMDHVNKILSLPLYPNISEAQQDYVVQKVSEFFRSQKQ